MPKLDQEVDEIDAAKYESTQRSERRLDFTREYFPVLLQNWAENHQGMLRVFQKRARVP